MEVDFATSGARVCCDEISYWYNKKANLITITLTSISINVQRVSPNSSETFGSTCLYLLQLFQKHIEDTLIEFGSIRFKPALPSQCLHQNKDHYA